MKLLMLTIKKVYLGVKIFLGVLQEVLICLRPQPTIAITKLEDQWLCGYYHHGVPSWQKHDDKPNTFSNSLDTG